jgi:hypothetical protein
MNNATLEELRLYLNSLKENNDLRLKESIVIRDTLGDYYPAEFLEFVGDDIMGDEKIIFQCYEWGEL